MSGYKYSTEYSYILQLLCVQPRYLQKLKKTLKHVSAVEYVAPAIKFCYLRGRKMIEFMAFDERVLIKNMVCNKIHFNKTASL